MKKRWAFMGVACLLAALFLGGVLAVGRTTQWFGLEVLAKGASPTWAYSYSTTWDPALSSVEGLDIGWGNGPVEIRAGQGTVITVTEYASRPLEEAEQLAVSSSGGVLKIRWDGSIVPLGLLQDWEKRLVVEVPQAVASQLEEFQCRNFFGDVAVSGFWAQDIQVASASGNVSIFYLNGETAKVSTVSGNVCWQGGNVSQLRVESTSGAVDLTGMTSQVCSLETASGPVHYQGEGKEFSVETVSAPMWAGLSSCPEEADLRSATGAISLSLPENNGFEAVHSSISGRFTSQFPGEEEDQTLRYKTGGAKLSFTTTSGDIQIKKQ